MNIMILNGSPKKKSSTSGFLGKVMGSCLINHDVNYFSLRIKNEYPKILQSLKYVDALILAVPLYGDGIP
ncbi:MAG: NAD(P)H-dependent oxidoreductase, partial [Ruminococcus sp.]|nr:NAD(P)H-dependent oxidoreductase [Ruminococcus sp.]